MGESADSIGELPRKAQVFIRPRHVAVHLRLDQQSVVCDVFYKARADGIEFWADICGIGMHDGLLEPRQIIHERLIMLRVDRYVALVLGAPPEMWVCRTVRPDEIFVTAPGRPVYGAAQQHDRWVWRLVKPEVVPMDHV